MCRWLAYTGAPQLIFDLLYTSPHSLLVQSLHSTMGAETTNGDGFGVGWYAAAVGTAAEKAALYRSVEPAWHDRNMRDCSQHIVARTVFAHVRAASPGIGSVQQTNCHPFRYGQWIWMHNGAIRKFSTIKRELLLQVDPKLFPSIEGSTDSEAFFYLALTFGLDEDPPTAVAKAAGYINKIGRENGIEYPLQMTVAVTDGEGMWAFRYSSERKSRTLFYSTDRETLMKLYPDNPMFAKYDNDSRFVVSEPLSDLPGVWNEVPEASCVRVHGPCIEVTPFEPIEVQC